MTRMPALAAALSLIALAGCDMPSSGSGSGGGGAATAAGARGASPLVEEACLSAVRVETGEENVAVLSSEFSEANSLVTVGVGAQRAPWRCLSSNDGLVSEVSFTGSEGAL